MKPPKELIELLHRFDLDVQAVALALRTSVVHEIGPCYESVLPIKKLVSILYSTTEKKMKDNICAIVVYRDHVNLMFTHGADLHDPFGLLQGAGKAIRHIKMFTPDDIERRAVRALLRQAKDRKGLGTPERPLRKVITIVKAKPDDAQPAWPRLF
jgi:hypothetical protein